MVLHGVCRLHHAIAVAKDVDGFNWQNLGALVEGAPGILPCTPRATMVMLDSAQIPIEGRHAVVVGRSNIVGKPVALLLIGRGATVTVCNSRTPDLGAITRQADILIVATGKAALVTGSMVKPGAAVIDVGINRLPSGKIAGDVAFDEVKEIAGLSKQIMQVRGILRTSVITSRSCRETAREINGSLPGSFT